MGFLLVIRNKFCKKSDSLKTKLCSLLLFFHRPCFFCIHTFLHQHRPDRLLKDFTQFRIYTWFMFDVWRYIDMTAVMNTLSTQRNSIGMYITRFVYKKLSALCCKVLIKRQITPCFVFDLMTNCYLGWHIG